MRSTQRSGRFESKLTAPYPSRVRVAARSEAHRYGGRARLSGASLGLSNKFDPNPMRRAGSSATALIARWIVMAFGRQPFSNSVFEQCETKAGFSNVCRRRGAELALKHARQLFVARRVVEPEPVAQNRASE